MHLLILYTILRIIENMRNTSKYVVYIFLQKALIVINRNSFKQTSIKYRFAYI